MIVQTIVILVITNVVTTKNVGVTVMQKNKCKDCKHYEEFTADEVIGCEDDEVEEILVGSGTCHLNPPQVYFNSGGVEDCNFPWVHESEWCSKFEKELNAET